MAISAWLPATSVDLKTIFIHPDHLAAMGFSSGDYSPSSSASASPALSYASSATDEDEPLSDDERDFGMDGLTFALDSPSPPAPPMDDIEDYFTFRTSLSASKTASLESSSMAASSPMVADRLTRHPSFSGSVHDKCILPKTSPRPPFEDFTNHSPLLVPTSPCAPNYFIASCRPSLVNCDAPQSPKSASAAVACPK